MKDIILTGSRLVFSKTARNTYTLFLGNTLDAFLAFLFTVLTFRLLSTSDFGIFSAINNFIVLAFSILDIGIGSGVINFISFHHTLNPEKSREYFKAGLILRATLASVISLVLIGFSWIISPRFFLTQEVPSVMLAGIAILGLSILDIVTFSLQGYQKFLQSAISSTSFSMIRVLFILLVISLKIEYSVTLAMFFSAVAPIVGVAIGLNFLKFSFRESHPSLSTYRSLLSFSGWVGINKLASSIAGRVDVQILLLLAGPAITGIYSVASRIASFYAVIITSFSAVVAPKLASGKPLRQLRPLLLKSILAQIGLISIMIFGIFISKPFILLLFGSKAEESITPFQGLTLANIPFIASSLSIIIIIYNLKKPKIIGLLSLFQAAIMIAGNILLIPRLGTLGPIITLGLANTVVLIVTSMVVFSHWKSQR